MNAYQRDSSRNFVADEGFWLFPDRTADERLAKGCLRNTKLRLPETAIQGLNASQQQTSPVWIVLTKFTCRQQ